MPRPMVTDAQLVDFCEAWDYYDSRDARSPLAGAWSRTPVHLIPQIEAWLLERMREVSPGYFPGGVVAVNLAKEEEERRGYAV